MNPVPAPRRSERGQVLVIVAGGLVVIVAMVGLVIDGGFAWSRQRDTQNGADAVAKAATIVVQHYIAGIDNPTPNDFDVACAVAGAAAENGVVVELAEYVDYAGESLLPNPVLVGDCRSDLGVGIPAGAQGVKARASETFDTFLMPVIGVPTLTTIADAIAVVGTLETITGGALPVTFPVDITICDSNETLFKIGEQDNDDPPNWEPYEILLPTDPLTSDNLAIVPLCFTEPGSVGWLDWDCGQRLALSITEPCPITIPIPAWVHTQTGNVNALEDELNSYAGSVVALPIHDFTCREDVPDNVEPEVDGVPPDPGCPSGEEEWSGNGDNLYYHIPFWIGFKLDQAYTQGGDFECQAGPGTPVLVDPQPRGAVGCLKGWFVAHYPAEGSVVIGPIDPGEVQNLAVTLIN